MSVQYFTPEGLKKLQEELNQLRAVERPRISQQIAEARDKGDLSENAEYHEAREEQAFNEGKIQELEDIIRNAVIIKENGHNKVKSVAEVGDKVDVQKNGENTTFSIVGSTEADPAKQKISNESPLGKALLGRSVGEEVQVTTPAGQATYKILRIS